MEERLVDAMHSTSTSLLVRLRQPEDREAWSRFVDLYTPLIYYWARRARMSPDDAADLVQEVLLVLVRKMPGFEYDRQKSFRGWLRTVTLNKWRERARRRALPMSEVDEADLANLPGPSSADEFWDTEYRKELVRRAVELMRARLPAATWNAFWECAVCGRPAREVADELGISVWTVYSTKSRLLKQLRQDLDGLLE